MLAILSQIISLAGEWIFMVSYVTGNNSFLKPLSAKEESMYIEKAKNGDTDAKNKLIEHNLRLVAHIAKKYSLKGFDNDDIISIGTIGLIKAIGSYNPEKKAGLATYAARCIENEILMTIRSGKKYQDEVLLQDPIGKDKDGKEVTLIDKLSNDEESIFDEVDLKLRISELYREMKNVLCERERKVLEMRYGLMGYDALTQKEISSMMGISRSYVSRIEKKAIGKLYKRMSRDF
ncbi:MAG: RNA polymerase sporulation sigma factor SigK [Clostridia bacterium]|nr:RNA polymerase sporulation sigma factor SigK [Clostridia bacterium]